MKTNYQDLDLKSRTMSKVGTNKKKHKKEEREVVRVSEDVTSENRRLLSEAQNYWDSIADIRDRDEKNRMYSRGDQWAEIIEDPDTGEAITEEDYLKNQGKVPFKQNIIRQLVKNLLGQYRTNPTVSTVIARDRADADSADMLSNALTSVSYANKLEELDVRNFEAFLHSGVVIGKSGYRYIKERNMEDVTYDNVQLNRAFWNTDVEDFRLKDLRLVGEILDLSLDDILSAFAKNDEEAKKIEMWYNNGKKGFEHTALEMGMDTKDSIDFLTTADPKMCRVIEVWYLKSEWRTYVHDYLDGTYNITEYSLDEVEELNNQRKQLYASVGVPEEDVPLMDADRKYEQFWCVKYLTPYGQCLLAMETPYKHEEHPYSLMLYPLLNGEVWGLIEDIIDQQRYINRLVTLMDFIMGSAAKGVLLIPEDSISDDFDIDEIAEEWSKFNGVIKLKLKDGAQMPKQIYSKASTVGVNELLALQMKLINDISGVHSAIQGSEAKSGTPSSLYAQQAQNATLNSKDLMESFRYFKEKRDAKILKTISQFYKSKRYLAVGGKDYEEDANVYDPERVRNIDVDVAVSQSHDTPVYRQIIDDVLFNMLSGGLIDLEMFLENSSLPFAEKLLDQVRKRKEEALQQQQIGAQAYPEEMMQEAQNVGNIASQQANPQTMQLINQALGRGA